MKVVEAESKQTIVSSQVVKWKLEVTKEMWDSDEVICLVVRGELPGNPRNSERNPGWLLLSPWKGEKSEEKERVFRFACKLDRKLAKQLQHEISVKTLDNSTKIIQSKTLLVHADEESVKDSQIVYRCFTGSMDDEPVSYQEILYVEVTLNVLAKESAQDLVPKEFLWNKRKHDEDDQFMEETSDVQVVCNGKSFPCHKYILCSQCPAFKSDLFNNCKEKKERRIEIEDSTPEAVEAMIQYLYGYDNEIPRDSELDILHLAEKYGLIPLKRKCGESMLKNLSAGNFLVTYTEIDRYLEEEPEFKKRAKDFLKRNAKEIFEEKNSWMKLTKDFPDLGYELVAILAKAF